MGTCETARPWTVAAVHPDGTIDAVPREDRDPTGDRGPGRQEQSVRLPARYVADHVELGYASTIHRAQGASVDTAHVLARDGITRQALYVAMTRGRDANHAYVPLDGLGEEHQASQLTGPQVLEGIVAADGAEHSATATLRQRQDQAASPPRLAPIRPRIVNPALPKERRMNTEHDPRNGSTSVRPIPGLLPLATGSAC